MTLDVGAAAPDFDLESDTGERMRLRDFEGEWLVLYFYPRDNTPGCTREAQDFTRTAARLRKLGARIVGVSRDTVKSHCSFRDKISIGFPLLSDPDLEAHRSFAAWGEKLMYGKRIEGTLRTTFLIAPNGRIAQVWRNVRVDGHAGAVADALVAATSTDGDGEAGPVKGKAPAKAATRAKTSGGAGRVAKVSAVKKASNAKSAKAGARTAKASKTGSTKGAGKARSAKGPKRARRT
jgi:peroxiredoxin Q/BCP